MPTVSDYIDFRGDLSFEVSPLNEIDLYIISKLGKPDYTGIVPEGFGGIPVEEAVPRFLEKYYPAEPDLGALASPEILATIKRMPDEERYRGLILTAYTLRISEKTVEQFSAMTVILPDGTAVVTFAGTDDTLVAWKEDLLMAADNAVPAQKDAAAYLEMAAGKLPGKIIVAGHSKGGNLAVYASAMASEDTRARISGIYNFDGPGFHHAFLSDPGYLSVKSRIHSILPRNSMVGVLMNRGEEISVAACAKHGIAAHDGFTWEVGRTAFVRAPSLSRESLAFKDSVSHALEGMDREERRAFIEELFSALQSSGAVTIEDMTDHRIRQAATILSSLKSASNSRRFASVVLRGMLRELAPLPIEPPEARASSLPENRE